MYKDTFGNSDITSGIAVINNGQISIKDSTLPSICYTVINMVRVWLGCG